MARYTVKVYDGEGLREHVADFKAEIELDDRLVEILLAGGKLVPVFHGFCTRWGMNSQTKEHGVLMMGRIPSDDIGVVTFELDEAVKAEDCGFPDAFLPNMDRKERKERGLVYGS